MDLIRKSLLTAEEVNLNAAPVQGPHRGVTVLEWATTFQRWDLVLALIKKQREPLQQNTIAAEYNKS